MNKTEFVAAVAGFTGVGKDVVKEVLQGAGFIAADVLAGQGTETVQVPGFGTFEPDSQVTFKPNPVMGGVTRSVRRIAHFSASRNFRESVSGNRWSVPDSSDQ